MLDLFIDIRRLSLLDKLETLEAIIRVTRIVREP
jgi:hypothetical protein